MLSRRLLRALTWAPFSTEPLPAAITPHLRCNAHQRSSCLEFHLPLVARRPASSSSKRWQNRQSNDKYTREARVQGLKSRAAFKLLELDTKHRIFKPGQTVVDLGYAPGSWSQVAMNRTHPTGRVLGIDLIPALPPTGVSTIQGDFLSPDIQNEVKRFLLDPSRGRPLKQRAFLSSDSPDTSTSSPALTQEDIEVLDRGYVDMERRATTSSDADGVAPGQDEAGGTPKADGGGTDTGSRTGGSGSGGQVVDVLLSDMSAPWPQTTGFGKRSLSNPYYRMMNTSGLAFRDHAGTMDLCNAALSFGVDTLRPGGHFVCKFYQGPEDKALEMRLKKVFDVVLRSKPDASRSDSKEAYFVGLRRKKGVRREDVFVAEQ